LITDIIIARPPGSQLHHIWPKKNYWVWRF